VATKRKAAVAPFRAVSLPSWFRLAQYSTGGHRCQEVKTCTRTRRETRGSLDKYPGWGYYVVVTDLMQGDELIIGGVETTLTVAAKAGVDRSVVRRALRSGVLRGAKLGRSWVIPAEAADRWIRTRKRGRPPKRPSQLALVEDVET